MTQKKIAYAELSMELEDILSDLQSGDLDVDDAIKKYERGAAIVEELETYLKDAENKVTKIKQRFDAK